MSGVESDSGRLWVQRLEGSLLTWRLGPIPVWEAGCESGTISLQFLASLYTSNDSIYNINSPDNLDRTTRQP